MYMEQLTSGRIHALDNLRAVIMWLGIVLHVAINHTTINATGLPWRDAAQSPVADFLLLFIHAFRMPAFFMLAGFLAAMLVDTRGVGAMFRNRLRRIALPFAVFWPFLLVGMGVLAVAFVHMMTYGTFGLEPGLMPRRPGSSAFNTMHMWFLYELMWLSTLAAIACALAPRLPAVLVRGWHRAWQLLVSRGWGVLLLALPLALAGAGFENGMAANTGSFIPHPPTLLQNGIFFACGWTLYLGRDEALARCARLGWRYLLAGLGAFIIAALLIGYAQKAAVRPQHINAMIAYCYGSVGILWSLALIGLFVRYLPSQNRTLRYLADSSYWVFLVHMLGTIGFGILLYNAPLGAVAKMSLNIVATSAACLLSYHLFVRRSWLGVLLNGRRAGQVPPAADAAPAPQLPTGVRS